MTWQYIKWRIRYYLQFIPFTFNTVLCALIAYAAYKLLYAPVPEDEDTFNAFRPFIIIMGKVAFWFFVVFIALSVLSTFLTWLYYVYLRLNTNTTLHVDFEIKQRKGKRNKLFLTAWLPKVRRPVLGFVKGRLIYDDNKMTGKFVLLSDKRKPKTFWREAIAGKSAIELPDIKEYQLKGGFVFFEDMLRLFSLAVPQPLSGHFYQPPFMLKGEDSDVSPKKTETMDVRIDQLRRVEGEYLNYKDFEAGDDVRRIVWKVYAKNRDLVVRMPERFEPYASHMYFYASFFAGVKKAWLDDSYLKEMLNHYKNNIWTVYDTLAKKEWQMRYVPDQSISIPENMSDTERDMRIISNSEWHKDNDLQHYFNARQGAVLCISSLTDVQDLQNILDQTDSSTIIYFVKLSQTFRHFVAWNWLKRLIFLPPKDRLSRLRTTWVFSPMRLQIQKREKEIEEALKKSNVIYGVL